MYKGNIIGKRNLVQLEYILYETRISNTFMILGDLDFYFLAL